jgi:hypothetical protein
LIFGTEKHGKKGFYALHGQVICFFRTLLTIKKKTMPTEARTQIT